MKKDALTKTVAVLGTIAVLIPIVMTLWAAIGGSIMAGRFLFDWLMPAELFPAAFVGGVLLLVAAWRAHAHRALIGWSMSVMVGAPLLGALVASWSGLASGRVEPTETGWWAVVIAMLVVYVGSVISVAVGGGLLLRDLFGHRNETAAGPTATPAM